MKARNVWVLAVVVGLAVVGGCKKKTPTTPLPTPAPVTVVVTASATPNLTQTFLAYTATYTATPTDTPSFTATFTFTPTFTYSPTASPTPTQGPVTVLYEPFENAMDAAWVFQSTGGNPSMTYSTISKAGTYAANFADGEKRLTYDLIPDITNGYIECWIYDTATDTSSCLVLAGGAPDMGIRAPDVPNNYMIQNPAYCFGPGGTCTLSVSRSTGWHLFRWELIGGTTKGYIDGVVVFTRTDISALGDIQIHSACASGWWPQNGSVDEVRAVRLP